MPGLDGCKKSRPPPGFDPRTVQPVASRYTDYAIPARTNTNTTTTTMMLHWENIIFTKYEERRYFNILFVVLLRIIAVL